MFIGLVCAQVGVAARLRRLSMRLPILLALTLVSLVARADAASQPEAATGPSAAQTARAKAQWQLSVSPTANDGTRSVLATLPADAPIPSGFSQVTPKLVLRYRSGQTVAYVACDTFLGDETVDAIATFGSEPPVAQKWTLSSDGRTAFVPGDALAFIRRLEKADAFSVRFSRPKHDPITISFTPTETNLVIKALLSAGVKYAR